MSKRKRHTTRAKPPQKKHHPFCIQSLIRGSGIVLACDGCWEIARQMAKTA